MDAEATLRKLAQWKAEGLVPADVHASAVQQVFSINVPAWVEAAKANPPPAAAAGKALTALQSCFEAWSKGDVPGMLALQAEAVLVRANGPEKSVAHGVYMGKKGFAKWIEDLAAGQEYFDMTATEWKGDDETASFLFTSSGRLKRTGATWKGFQSRIAITVNDAGLIKRWDNSELQFKQYEIMTEHRQIIRTEMKIKAGTKDAFQAAADKLFPKILGMQGFIGNGVAWKSDTEAVGYSFMEYGTDDAASQEAAKPLWGTVMDMLDGAPKREVLSGVYFQTNKSYAGKCAVSNAVLTIKEGETANMYKWIHENSSEIMKLGMVAMGLVEHNPTTFETVVFYPSVQVATDNQGLFAKYVKMMMPMLAGTPERAVYPDASCTTGHDMLVFYLEQTFETPEAAVAATAFSKKMNAENIDCTNNISMSYTSGSVMTSCFAFQPEFWLQWNANMMLYMDEMMAGFTAKSSKCYYAGKVTPAVRAALEGWKQVPNMEIIEAEVINGGCSFKGGFPGREGTGYLNRFTIKAGTEAQYNAMSAKLPAMGFSGDDFSFVFKIAENTYVQIGADTPAHWKAMQTKMQTDPAFKGLVGEWISVMDHCDARSFGALDAESKAMWEGWNAAPFCDVFYHQGEMNQPQRINY